MEKIVEVNSSKQFQKDYTRYGVYTIYARVLSDYRDGLKPIHRRILWAMYNDCHAINNTVKTATVVGQVMGHYHAHGDQSVNDSIKPMLNWFECKIPLLEGQGHFGTFQGDPASAPRYTECKLSKFAYDYIIGDLRESKECVDWQPNFSNTLMEPQYLPAALPLLLINGTFAIGVGKKPEIPSHNLAEVIDATVELMKNPNYNPVLIPDHCMNCEIVNTDWESISRNGYGFYTVRGIIDIDNDYCEDHHKHRIALIIRSVPNLTFLNSVTDKIESMITDKKIIQIEEYVDKSKGDNMKYVIILKPGADVEYVRNMIYKNTLMEQTLRINFESLSNLNPVRMNYRGYLLSFIDQRKLTKFRVYTNRLQDVQTKIHEKDAFIKALSSGKIDEIIARIRSRKTVADDNALIEWLIKTLKITALQAQYIINVKLKNLQEGNLAKLKAEAKELEKLKADYMDIILSEDRLSQIIIDELLEIKAKYGVPRTCKIISADNGTDIPKGAMTVGITEKNFIKKVPFGSNMPNTKNDSIRSIVNVDNADSLLIFDNMGKVFRLPVHKIPFADKGSNGTDIRFLIKGLTANIADIKPEILFETYNDLKHYLVTITKGGHIKRMNLEDFVNIPSSGLIYAKLDQGDFVQSIAVAYDGMDVLVFSEKKAMSIPLDRIPIMKRNAMGNKTFKSSLIDGMTLLPPKDSLQYNSMSLLVITDSGKFNKLPINGIPNINIPKKTFSVIKINKGDRIIDIHAVDENSVVTIKTLTDMHQIPVNIIPPSSSISNGEKLLNTTKDKIVRTYIQ